MGKASRVEMLIAEATLISNLKKAGFSTAGDRKEAITFNARRKDIVKCLRIIRSADRGMRKHTEYGIVLAEKATAYNTRASLTFVPEICRDMYELMPQRV